MSKRRTGTITKEQAITRFNEYYDRKNKTAAGRRRGKLMDMMYQKKLSKVLIPGEPGSEKYMLEAGPKTFDMEGVDYFPEGTDFELQTNQGLIKGRSKGSLWHQGDDPDLGLSELNAEGKRKCKKGEPKCKIYGPRTKKGELYSKRFETDYKTRRSQGDLNKRRDLKQDKII